MGGVIPSLVALPLTLALALADGCAERSTGPRIPADAISLGVGQTRVVAPDAAAPMHVVGGTSGAEYTLVAFASPNGPVIPLQITAEAVSDVAGPPTPDLIAPPTDAVMSVVPTGRSLDLSERLPASEREHLSSLLDAARAMYPSTPRAAVVPSVGDELMLNVSLDACGLPVLHTGRVVTVSDHAVLVEDEANPAGGFTADDYQSIADEYETLVYPVLTDNFGAPSDIDDNGGRTIVFFTRAVNELTPRGASGYVAGFSYIRDLIPKSGSPSCAGSNEAELIYQMVPDPTGAINGVAWQAAFVRETVGGSLAHAGQHLVNEGRRLYTTHAPIEQMWLDEALSDIANELVFYRATGLAPGHNLSLDDLRASNATVTALNRYQGNNLIDLQYYLADPESHSPMAGDGEFATNGAAWQFLRYLADRSTVPERTLWTSLVDASTTGTANLAAATGLDIVAAERDWAVAQYTDDAGIRVDPTLQYPSWNFRSVLPAIADLGYSLAPHLLTAATPLSITLERGGASYMRFAVAGGQYASIQVTPADLAAMGKFLSLTLVRTK